MKILIAGVAKETASKLKSLTTADGDDLYLSDSYSNSLSLLEQNPEILVLGDNLSAQEQHDLLEVIHANDMQSTTLYLSDELGANFLDGIDNVPVDDFLKSPYTDSMLQQKLQHVKKYHTLCDRYHESFANEGESQHVTPIKQLIEGPLDWHLAFDLHSKSLAVFDPLPILLHILMESQELKAHKGPLYTILAELYTNALDHGVLKLESAMKLDPKGFVEYYELKEQRLKELHEGNIRFDISHAPVEHGGCLSIVVEDSGPGFDFKKFLNKSFKRNGYSGRGIPLLEKLCKSVKYNNAGNQVEVKYIWQDSNEVA